MTYDHISKNAVRFQDFFFLLISEVWSIRFTYNGFIVWSKINWSKVQHESSKISGNETMQLNNGYQHKE